MFLLSLTATCQVWTVSLKAGLNTYNGLHLAQELQNPFATAAAYHYRGMLYDQYGAWPQALADYEAAQRLAAQAGDRFRSYIVQVWAGRAHTMAGNPSRGRTLLEESMTLAKQLGNTPELARTYVHYAHLLQGQGQTDQAREYLAQASNLFRHLGMAWDLAQAEQARCALA
jgi:tetratricopeptide (TPR) repeat protein